MCLYLLRHLQADASLCPHRCQRNRHYKKRMGDVSRHGHFLKNLDTGSRVKTEIKDDKGYNYLIVFNIKSVL